MQAIFFALTIFFLWGIGDVFGTSLTRKLGGIKTATYLFLSVLPIHGAVALFYLDNLKNLTPQIFILNLALGTIGVMSMLTFYEGLRVGNASLVTTISASFVWLTVTLSLIFLGEKITLLQAVAIAIIVIGIIISSLNYKELRSGKSKLEKGVLFGLATMVLWGLYWAFIKIPIQHIGWAWPNFFGVLPVALALVFAKIQKIKIQFTDFKKYPRLLFLNAAFLGSGVALYNFAIHSGAQISIITPIANSYPILLVILLYIFFKDPITKQQILGIATTLTGIVLLSIFSV